MNCKILANKEQLEIIGIDYEITGLEGEFIKEFPSRYCQVKVSHNYKGMTFTNDFDIPKHLLKFENR